MTITTNVAASLRPRWTTGLGDYVTTVSPAPDGARLLAGSLSGEAALIDPATGSTVLELERHPMGTLAGAWSADGTLLATAGQDDRLRLIRAADGSPVNEVELDGWGTAVQWSPTDELVAVAAGRSLTVVDGSGELVGHWSELGSTATAVAWSADGISVGVACYGGIHWFRPRDTGRPATQFAWKGSLLSLARSPDGKWVAAGGQDATVHVWRLWSGDDLAMTGYPAKVEHITWDPTSRYLAVGNVGDVTVWDFAGRGPRGTSPKTLAGHTRHVTALAYRPDAKVLASVDAAGALFLWATPKRTKPIAEIALGEAGSVLAWQPDGKQLFVGGGNGGVLAFEVDPAG